MRRHLLYSNLASLLLFFCARHSGACSAAQRRMGMMVRGTQE
jgi:hypothetical protein